MTKTLMGSARQRSKLRVGNPNADLFPVRSEQSFIQWPTEQQIQEVSERLARIRRVGIRSEANGDYFRSGDPVDCRVLVVRPLASRKVVRPAASDAVLRVCPAASL
jgi:hypothetical protein